MKALIAGSVVITGIVMSFYPTSDAMAQAYRCGNVYQDRPCASNSSSKPVRGVVMNTGSKNSAESAGAIHPTCARRGADTQKIVWAREGGVTEEKALAAESNSRRRKLIADVYRVRGAAPDVRARIEAECKAEMDERAKALAIREAMTRAGVAPSGPAVPAGPSAGEIAAQQAAADRQAQAAEQRADAREMKRRCNRLAQELATNRAMQRGRGSARQMERLNRVRSNLEQENRDAGC